MRDGEQGDAGVLGRLVHVALDVHAHGAGALVQQGERRPGRKKKTNEGDRVVNVNVLYSVTITIEWSSIIIR